MESEPVYAWHYELHGRAGLNARSARRDFPGALIRIGSGFGCLHPWTELGDPPLPALLAAVAAGDDSEPLAKRARACARRDGRAREAGTSLFAGDGVEVPRSHATVPDWNPEHIEQAVDRGFDRIKLKCGADLREEGRTFRAWVTRWPALRWRLDCNGVPRREALQEFVGSLTAEAMARIDFVEDPFDYEAGTWEAFARDSGLRLAIDRGAETFAGGAAVLVWKPALLESAAVEAVAAGHDLEVVATSYMDHPLGQCFAAAEAARHPGLGVGGLQTHELFEPTAFSESLGPAGPAFRIPPGTGLGFDRILEGLPWKRLT
ncbi:MAG: hypothetical protein HKN82_14050 [Akkermansiaceae bacterium]|nr:hypothetical protein [Akkermansiaceae bacterium]